MIANTHTTTHTETNAHTKSTINLTNMQENTEELDKLGLFISESRSSSQPYHERRKLHHRPKSNDIRLASLVFTKIERGIQTNYESMDSKVFFLLFI